VTLGKIIQDYGRVSAFPQEEINMATDVTRAADYENARHINKI
jgi:hypothetical protein